MGGLCVSSACATIKNDPTPRGPQFLFSHCSVAWLKPDVYIETHISHRDEEKHIFRACRVAHLAYNIIYNSQL